MKPGVPAAWQAVEQTAPRDRVREAAAVAGELVPDDPAGEAAMHAALAGRYRVVRPFLVLLAEALPLAAAPARQKILTVVRGLPGLAPGGCGSARLPAPRSTLPLCRRCGAARCTAIGIFPPGRWTGMPACCASWSNCVPRWAAVTCSPRGRLRWAAPRAMLLDLARSLLPRGGAWAPGGA